MQFGDPQIDGQDKGEDTNGVSIKTFSNLKSSKPKGLLPLKNFLPKEVTDMKQKEERRRAQKEERRRAHILGPTSKTSQLKLSSLIQIQTEQAKRVLLNLISNQKMEISKT